MSDYITISSDEESPQVKHFAPKKINQLGNGFKIFRFFFAMVDYRNLDEENYIKCKECLVRDVKSSPLAFLCDFYPGLQFTIEEDAFTHIKGTVDSPTTKKIQSFFSLHKNMPSSKYWLCKVWQVCGLRSIKSNVPSVGASGTRSYYFR